MSAKAWPRSTSTHPASLLDRHSATARSNSKSGPSSTLMRWVCLTVVPSQARHSPHDLHFDSPLNHTKIQICCAPGQHSTLFGVCSQGSGPVVQHPWKRPSKRAAIHAQENSLSCSYSCADGVQHNCAAAHLMAPSTLQHSLPLSSCPWPAARRGRGQSSANTL